MRRHQRHPDPLGPRRGRRGPRGITLLELMLSASLGVVVLVAATIMLLAASRVRRNQQLLSDANQEARTALKHVARTLASAGAGGSTFVFQDKDGTVQYQTPVLFFRNGAGNPTTVPPLPAVPLKDMAGVQVPASITSTSMKQQPDEIIVLRYGVDRRTELVGPLAGSVVLMAPDARQTDTPGVVGSIFTKGESALITNFARAMLLPVYSSTINSGTQTLEVDVRPVPAAKLQDPYVSIQPGATVFPVTVIRYRLAYVPKVANFPERTDLLMETLDPATLLMPVPTVVNKVVLARDVEDFQVQWGYDYNTDGVADTGYTDNGPSSRALDVSIAFARINLAVRTSTFLQDDKGEFIPSTKTELTPFELGLDASVGGTPLDPLKPNGYRRRIMSTVVALKNIDSTRL